MRAEPPASAPDPFGDPDEARFRENLDRITRIVGRSLMIGIPVFFLVLWLLLPAWRYVRGPGGVTIAFLGAVAAAWALERWVGRRLRPPPHPPVPARSTGRPARAPSPARWLVFAGLGLVALAYVVFVLVASGGGG